jgi:NADH-quinone oxidoreductase subunit L
MAGPTPVSALIHAATMVTAGIYMIARSNILFTAAPLTLNVIAIVGAATAFLAATIAIRQNDIKKVLAYSTVSQLGYMFLALGTGAYVAAVFHVMTHAFFKALLFLGSGSVIHAVSGQQDIRYMGGLRKKLPVTYYTFLVGCLAIAGIAPFAGFFSKDAILLSVFASGNIVLYAVGLLTAGLTAFYMFRLLFITFSSSFRGTEEQAHHLHESPLAMTIPLIVLAILSIVGGFVGIPELFMHGGEKLSDFLSPVVKSREVTVDHATEWILVALTTVIALAAIAFAYMRYRRYSDEKETPVTRILENKWYVDELYNAVIVRQLHRFGGFVNTFIEKGTIDAMVNGVGRAVNYGGRQMRWLQSGQVGNYVLLMVISMVLLLVLQFFLRR